MEPLLDVPSGCVPRRSAHLDAYMRAMLDGGTIAVSDTSRALARAVLSPPGWRLLWAAFRPVHLITIGLLPPQISDAYEFSWCATDERALRRWTRALRSLRRTMPAWAREWPSARQRLTFYT